MHELSLAMEVIDLASWEAEKNGVSRIFEIEIEVGDLSGVEADAFQSALEMIVVDTILEKSEIKIVRQPAIGWCSSCRKDFLMRERMAVCPDCKEFPEKIEGGTEFRVVAIVAE